MAARTNITSTSHSAVKGPSLRDVYAQQKADEELNSLLSSQGPGAHAKAFARGLAAGAAMPLLLSAVPWATQSKQIMGNIETQAHVAHLLQQKIPGMSEDQARAAAAGAVRYLRDSDTLPEEVRRALSQSVTVPTPKPEVFGAMPPAVRDALAAKPLEQQLDFFVENAKRHGRDLTREQALGDYFTRTGVSLPSGGRPSASAAKGILDVARESYQAAGKKAPGMAGPMAKSFGKMVQHALPTAAAFGLVGGISALQVHRRKAKKARELQKAAQEQPSMLEQGMAAAPGLAAIPGAVIGFGDPHTFDPATLLGKERASKWLGHASSLRGRLASGIVGAGALATAAGLPGILYNSYKALTGGSKPADTSTAPIIVQKQAAALPHMMDELASIYGVTP